MLQQSTQTIFLDTEYLILENIYDSSAQNEPIRQRDLAQIAGASLGMTNSILKKLTQKGWITVNKLNSRNIQYAITLEGINEIIHRSYRYFKKTIKNVVYFKEILDKVILQASKNNVTTVILAGNSDLDFIVEHACLRHGLHFISMASAEGSADYNSPNTLKIFPENIAEPSAIEHNAYLQSSPKPDSQSNCFYLSRLIIRQFPAMESPINNQLLGTHQN